MLDGMLLALVAVALAIWTLWMSPQALRFVASRMWARAHAIEVARAAYAKTVAQIESEQRG